MNIGQKVSWAIEDTTGRYYGLIISKVDNGCVFVAIPTENKAVATVLYIAAAILTIEA